MPLPPRLVRPLPVLAWVGLALLAVGLGLAQAAALGATTPSARPDVAFKLAAMLALPMPVAALLLLTTPPHATLRLMLGEASTQLLQRSMNASRGVFLVALPAPVTCVLAGAGADWMLAGTLGLLTLASATVLGHVAVLLAMRAMASHAGASAWSALTGGGAFGPADAAPLLYAPALAFVAALIPAALLSAWWGAAPDLASPLGFLAVAAALTVSLGAVAHAQTRRARRTWQNALLAVEQAHATPFALSAALPAPPAWLPRHDAIALFLARSWFRHHPASLLASLGLVALTAWLVHRPHAAPSFLIAAALALHGATRATALAREPVAAAAAWLGATPMMITRAQRQLAAALSVPSLAVVLLALLGAPWLALLAGAGAGAALGLGLSVRPQPWHLSLPRLALLTWGAGIAWATGG